MHNIYTHHILATHIHIHLYTLYAYTTGHFGQVPSSFGGCRRDFFFAQTVGGNSDNTRSYKSSYHNGGAQAFIPLNELQKQYTPSAFDHSDEVVTSLHPLIRLIPIPYTPYTPYNPYNPYTLPCSTSISKTSCICSATPTRTQTL